MSKLQKEILEAHQLLGDLTMYECAQALSSHTREYVPSDLCAQYQRLRNMKQLTVVGEKYNTRTDKKRQRRVSEIYNIV